jgi:2'-5' RNA ligase
VAYQVKKNFKFMRTFVALPVPDEITKTLVSSRDDLLRTWPHQLQRQLQPVRAEAMHLTLLFLGEVDSANAEKIATSLRSVAQHFAPIRLAAARLGCFPNASRPRVLWAGLEGDIAVLTQLHASLQAAIAPDCPNIDLKPFRPHLTLARIRASRPVEGSKENGSSSKNLSTLMRLAVEESRNIQFGGWTVGEVHLLQSELDPRGARYTLLATANLGG